MTSAIPVQRSNQLSYQANWELVNCEFVIYPWMDGYHPGTTPVNLDLGFVTDVLGVDV